MDAGKYTYDTVDVTNKPQSEEMLLLPIERTLRAVEWVHCLFLFPLVLGKI